LDTINFSKLARSWLNFFTKYCTIKAPFRYTFPKFLKFFTKFRNCEFNWKIKNLTYIFPFKKNLKDKNNWHIYLNIVQIKWFINSL
jgi:hypothetical protein